MGPGNDQRQAGENGAGDAGSEMKRRRHRDEEAEAGRETEIKRYREKQMA